MRKVDGPYRVVPTGRNRWEVIEIVGDQYVKLRPSAEYSVKGSAYGKCWRLNKRWQAKNGPISVIS